MAEKQQYTQLQFGFDIRTGSPVDRRMVLSYEEMALGQVTWNDKLIPLINILPDRYIVICSGADNPAKYPYQEEHFKGKLFIFDASTYHDEDNYHIPLGNASNGVFIMVSNTIDVVDSEGNSLINEDGVVKIYDPDGGRILRAEQRLDVAEADIAQLDIEKVDEDQVADVVDEKLEKYQRRTLIYGSGDYLDSEGDPKPKTGTDGYGVHVTVERNDTEPWKALIDHTAVVPAGGWVSKYNVGGVAIGQAFMEGTKIDDVLKQLFEGDPKTDNVVCYIEYNREPSVNMYWTDTAWRQIPIKRDALLANGIELHFEPNRQFILIALPISMINDYGQDPTVEFPVRLKELYNKNAPEFTYAFRYVDIKNSSVAVDIGYRVYYLPNKVTGTQDIICEFEKNI